ncbi:Reticulon-domain-containing protein [Aspergillus minisclerotigenes]|uniref:Reticulon-like protein n=1 Tax=Aspergillus minisclerotigenes TaxID=656917 RepID=A0A5N6JES9_9EURO|nr:Reticulon-domain-containing protein [Aspergillus minisclerotigenes]
MAESTRPGEVSYPDTNGSSIKNAVTNGPVVDHIKSEAARTEQELRELKNARVTPSTTTATGQHLTYYHSLLYSLLSWEQPRATAVSFATVVTFIFAARYLPLLRWFFKFIYVALGFTAAAELGGRLVLSQGLASSFRPRKYYTIPKETIEGVYEDLEQLLNFVLLEFQRILFAENIVHTVAAFAAAFSAYWLIKWLPFWGLSLIAVTIAYIGPLVYMNNREVIDAQIENIQEVVNSQAHQLKDLAEERTSHATGLMKQYVDDYSAKAQEYIGQRRSVSPQMTKVSTPEPVIKKEIDTEPVFKTTDFPEAPKEEPVAVKEEPVAVAESIEHPALNAEKEPLLAA